VSQNLVQKMLCGEQKPQSLQKSAVGSQEWRGAAAWPFCRGALALLILAALAGTDLSRHMAPRRIRLP
jgi:hypothetical protein